MILQLFFFASLPSDHSQCNNRNHLMIYDHILKEIEYRNYTEIEMRRKNQIPTWQEVVYQDNSDVPTERWGHQLVKVSEDRIILFGGFGGNTSEGKYLDDLWQFNTTTFTWKQLHPLGQIPQKRSNYIIHHNSIDHQLILFGGGSSNKIRYNDICILDLATLTWSKYLPDPAEQAPWERTYHSGVFLFPFLVIFGGEGGPNIDLDDSWSFNIQTKKWKRLLFQQNNQHPDRRRFHSSVLIGTSMYILSGCKNGNYDLFGDIHKVDLKRLLEQNQQRPLVWERVVQNNPNLRRWGQSCNVFDGKIFVVAGRINQNSDTNSIVTYNPQDHSVQEVKLSNKNLPSPRRRHSSIMIDSSLLIFGGYNCKYFNDFHFLSLKGIQNKNLFVQPKIYSPKQFEAQLFLQESKLKSDCLLELHFQENAMKIKSNQHIFNKNEYLKYLYKYNEDKKLVKIDLPLFCSITSFRVIHLFLSTNSAIFSADFSHQSYIQLLKSAQYFNCSQIYPFIDSQLTKFLTFENVKDLLKECIRFPLYTFISSAVDFIIQHKINFSNKRCKAEEDNAKTMKSLRAESDIFVESKEDYSIYLMLKQAQKSSLFDISQAFLRNKKASIFLRATNRIKTVFSSRQEQDHSTKTISETSKEKGSHPGCLQRLINFFTAFSFSE